MNFFEIWKCTQTLQWCDTKVQFYDMQSRVYMIRKIDDPFKLNTIFEHNYFQILISMAYTYLHWIEALHFTSLFHSFTILLFSTCINKTDTYR